jgi:hypothetical protein
MAGVQVEAIEVLASRATMATPRKPTMYQRGERRWCQNAGVGQVPLRCAKLRYRVIGALFFNGNRRRGIGSKIEANAVF